MGRAVGASQQVLEVARKAVRDRASVDCAQVSRHKLSCPRFWRRGELR